MGIRDWFRRKPQWTPEASSDDSWSPVVARSKGQRQGPIQAPLRNSHRPVLDNHDNRAGHREFVRLHQTRQVRINIVGFGRWRRYGARIAARAYGSHAANNAQVPMLPRWLRRIEHRHNYRMARKNRLRSR